MKKKSAIIILIVWLVGIPIALGIVNWGMYALLKGAYDEVSLGKYVDRCEQFLKPDEYVKNVENAKISAVLTLRGLLDRTELEIGIGNKISAKTEQNIQFLCADGADRLTKGIWMPVVCSSDTEKMSPIKETVGIISVEKLSETSYFEQLFTAIENDPMSNVEVTRYGICQYEIIPLNIRVTASDGSTIEEFSTEDISEEYEIIDAENTYIYNSKDYYKDGDTMSDSDNQLYYAMKLAKEPYRGVDKKADELAAGVDWSKKEANNTEDVKMGLGYYEKSLVKVSGDYAEIVVSRHIYKAAVLGFTMYFFGVWSVICVIIAVVLALKGKISARAEE